MSVLEQILDAARWAPSGDNTQPWRFQLVGAQHVVVHGHDTRSHCVYDLEGEASQLSMGAMLETMAIAASVHGWAADVARRTDTPEEQPMFDVRFRTNAAAPDALADCILRRAVQRRPMSTQVITDHEKWLLGGGLSAGYRLVWFESLAERWECAKLMFRNAYLRLTMPEAYEVHRAVIEWGARESTDRVPDQALGADPLSLQLMRVAMKSWERVRFANRFLAGTWIPRLQLDVVPSLACAAHWVVVAPHEPDGIDDFIAAGRQVQRLWLTATGLGLWQQPEMTPLIFARYHRRQRRFTQVARLQTRAGALAAELERLLGQHAASAVWMGRLGTGAAPTARSLRRPLSELIVDVSPLVDPTRAQNR